MSTTLFDKMDLMEIANGIFDLIIKKKIYFTLDSDEKFLLKDEEENKAKATALNWIFSNIHYCNTIAYITRYKTKNIEIDYNYNYIKIEYKNKLSEIKIYELINSIIYNLDGFNCEGVVQRLEVIKEDIVNYLINSGRLRINEKE